MVFELDEAEVRVLGALMEKEVATPEYYPLSVNALVNACNQKSNRDPVVSYDDSTVESALADLRAKGLAVRISGNYQRRDGFVHHRVSHLRSSTGFASHQPSSSSATSKTPGICLRLELRRFG